MRILISTLLVLILSASTVSAEYRFTLDLVTKSRDARSTSEYEVWLSDERIRYDRTAKVFGVENTGQAFEWDRLVLRGDDDRRLEINVEKRSYVDRPLSSYDKRALAIEPREKPKKKSQDSEQLADIHFKLIEIGAKETISGVETRRLLLTTHGREYERSPGSPDFIYVADLWVPKKKFDELAFRSLLPSIDRELSLVWSLANPDADAINHIAALGALLGEILDREWTPLRSTLGIVQLGYDDEKIAKRVSEISGYADLPIMKIVQYEIYDFEEIVIPETRFDVPAGFSRVNR